MAALPFGLAAAAAAAASGKEERVVSPQNAGVKRALDVVDLSMDAPVERDVVCVSDDEGKEETKPRGAKQAKSEPFSFIDLDSPRESSSSSSSSSSTLPYVPSFSPFGGIWNPQPSAADVAKAAADRKKADDAHNEMAAKIKAEEDKKAQVEADKAKVDAEKREFEEMAAKLKAAKSEVVALEKKHERDEFDYSKDADVKAYEDLAEEMAKKKKAVRALWRKLNSTFNLEDDIVDVEAEDGKSEAVAFDDADAVIIDSDLDLAEEEADEKGLEGSAPDEDADAGKEEKDDGAAVVDEEALQAKIQPGFCNDMAEELEKKYAGDAPAAAEELKTILARKEGRLPARWVAEDQERAKREKEEKEEKKKRREKNQQ